ncbi:unnamed protein product, partial [Staurois parvus]
RLVVDCFPETQRITIRGDIYTDHQGKDDQCALMISVAPSVPPVSATSMPHISAYHCTSMPHISAHLSCFSVPPISASQYRLLVLQISATYQCQSLLLISTSQCRLSVPVSAAVQCLSV